MEIIKRGKLPSDKEYTGTCRNCKTEIKFRQREGRIVYDQRDGDAVVVNCPVCKQEIWVAL